MESPETKFGKYVLVRKIASGGMAEIWLARQEGMAGFAREVVIKRIHAHLSKDEEFVSMFLDEARLVAKLSHPNIVSVHEFGQEGKTHYLVMEYVDGEPLSSAIKRSRGLDPAHGLRIVSEMCAGLDYAHSLKDAKGESLNIVHRDVSPQNVLLGYDGSVKLIDFGVAKAETQSHETRVGSFKGKYAYMSPEQARGKTADHRSDIHSVGIVAWELLTGRSLFHRESVFHSMEAVLSMRPPSVRGRVPTLPRGIDDILDKALAKDPDDRYQSCGEMQAALEEYIAESGLYASSVSLGRYVRKLFRKESHPPPSNDDLDYEELEELDIEEDDGAVPQNEAPLGGGANQAAARPASEPPSGALDVGALLDGASRAPTESGSPPGWTGSPSRPAERAPFEPAMRAATPTGGVRLPEVTPTGGVRLPEVTPTGGVRLPEVTPSGGVRLPEVTPSGGVRLPEVTPTGGVRLPEVTPTGGVRLPEMTPSGGVPLPGARGTSPAPPAPPASTSTPPEGPERAERGVLPFVAVGVVGLLAIGAAVLYIFATAPPAPGEASRADAAVAVAPTPDAGDSANDRDAVAPSKVTPPDAAPRLLGDQDASQAGDVEPFGVELVGAFLTILSSPPSARVLIDGRSAGERTPIRELPVDPGEHAVDVILDGHRRWRKRVTVSPGETLTLRATLPAVGGATPGRSGEGDEVEYGMLSVDTTPPSRVYRGRKSLGRTPLSGIELPAGNHTLTFVVDGGGRHRKSISIRPGRSTRRTFDFTGGDG